MSNVKNNINYEYDSTNKAWKHYKDIYRCSVIDDMFDLQNLVIKARGFVAKGKLCKDEKWNQLLEDKNIEVLIGGDVSFNLSEKKCSYYKKLCKNNNKLLDKINVLQMKNHNIVNLSLLLRTGNLQRIRRWAKSDFLPAFLVYLNDYFNGDRNDMTHYIFSGNNRNCKNIDKRKIAIKLYLAKFKDIYEYCKVIHKVDKKNIVNKALDIGKKDILTENDVKEYLELIEEFWKYKEEYLNSIRII